MIKTYTLRIDEKVFDFAKKRAIREKRSIAKEIEFVLEAYYSSLTTEKHLKKIR